VRAIHGWVACAQVCDAAFSVYAKLSECLQRPRSGVKVYVALYLTARAMLDYRAEAAMHVFCARSGVTVKP